MHVRFWGTRGSIASPGGGTAHYGGNTSCVEIRAAGTHIILDCGTGARELGLHLARTAAQPVRLHLFIGHTHWDHIQGFPFFVPAFLTGAELNIYAPSGFQRSLEEAMAGQMEYSYFPVKLRDLRSRIHFTELDEGFFRVGDVLVETQYLNHTAPTIAYRMSNGGATVAYVTDHEPFGSRAGGTFHHPGDQRHVGFLRGADLVIHDAQYTEDEYRTKIGWGHSPIDYAIDVARAAEVRRLVLFHHDPGHDDDTVRKLEAAARARVKAEGLRLEVLAAAEGLTLEVTGDRAAMPVGDSSALARRPIAGGRVLVVSANTDELAALDELFVEDGLVVQVVPDIRRALERAPEIVPDLAIIDAKLPDGDGTTLVRPLRQRVGRRALPVVLLTEPGEAARVVDDVEGAPTDFVSKPFSPPMLHARVRAWLARALTSDEVRAPGEAADALVAAARAPTRSASESRRSGYAELMAATPLFRTLSPDVREALAAQATDRLYAPGQAIIGEDEFADRVFVVLSGRVRVIESVPEGHTDAFLGELGEGEIFGELGILTERVRAATVVAVEHTRCLILRQRAFVQALEASPQLALSLLRIIAGRLYEADRRIARYAPDPLTGLPSRRTFHDQYRRLAAAARRRGSTVLLLAFDVLRLRDVNDRFGYTVGDELLRAMADALMEATRSTDLVARSGGDEFAILLVDAGLKDVDLVVPRVADKLAEFAIRRRLPVPITCMVGAAFRELAPESADDLLQEADRDMRARGRRLPG